MQLSESVTAHCLVNAIQDLRHLCWSEAGVKRTFRGMQDALTSVQNDFDYLISQPLLKFMKNQSTNICTRFDEISRRDLNLLLDLSNRQMTSSLMLEACLFRRESRGGHFRTDVPLAVPYWECHSRQQLGKTISTRPVKL